MQAAQREVREETGIVAEPVRELGESRYWYRRDGRTIAKSVHFFLFRYLGGDTADHDDEVEEARWIGLDRGCRSSSPIRRARNGRRRWRIWRKRAQRPIACRRVQVLNFYSTIFADELKRGRKTATIRLGDKSGKYRKNQAVLVTIGYQYSPRERIFEAVIDQVEVMKEGTLTLDYRPADHFLMRGEYRRDQSNRLYFLGHTLGILEGSQPTIGLGLVWWFGQKDGVW